MTHLRTDIGGDSHLHVSSDITAPLLSACFFASSSPCKSVIMALDAKLISRSNDPSHQEAPTDAEAVTTTAAAGPGQWRLLYFDAPTRGEQLRLLFRLAKQPFDDVRLVWPSGIAPYKHAALGDASPLLFDQCPMVTSPDGHHTDGGNRVSQIGHIDLEKPRGCCCCCCGCCCCGD